MSNEWDLEEDIIEPISLIIADVAQGSAEWELMRAGKVTASRISDVLAKGEGKTRDSYKKQLVAERLTGKASQKSFKSKAMARGNELEPIAREHYEFVTSADIAQIAFVNHPSIKWAGASPDCLVDHNGLAEFKCPDIETHIDYILNKKIPTGYMNQMHWQLACMPEREWNDWVSYCPELNMNNRAVIIRVERDEKIIKKIESEVIKFLDEVEELIIKLGY